MKKLNLFQAVKNRKAAQKGRESGNKIIEHYSTHNEDDRFSSRHGQVEFITTMRYIEKYLFEGAHILEIGAASGRYSHAIAQKGYKVDAVELTPYNIEIFKSKTKKGENISIREGNALDLSFFEDESYDMTLLLGPMYHLYNEKDKLQALSEALRVTKKGGTVFVAYCLRDASIYMYGFMGKHIFEIIESGLLETEGFTTLSTDKEVFEIVRKDEIDRLVAHFDVERLNYVATDLYTNHFKETVDKMDDKTFEVYLKYHFFLCERPDMQGLSHHSVDILRKN